MFVRAVKWARDLINQPAMREVSSGELSPDTRFQSDEEILDAAREILSPGTTRFQSVKWASTAIEWLWLTRN